jgi:hypothetical protein
MSQAKELYEWDVQDVANWLNTRGLKNYIENFRSNNITGYDLCFIGAEDLKTEIRISNLHERLAILKEIRKLILENCNNFIIV